MNKNRLRKEVLSKHLTRKIERFWNGAVNVSPEGSKHVFKLNNGLMYLQYFKNEEYD